MNLPLFRDEKRNLNFYLDVDSDLKCDICQKNIFVNERVFIKCFWKIKNKSEIYRLCFKCRKYDEIADVKQFKFFFVENKFKIGMVPEVWQPPSLIQSSKFLDVFAAAEIPTPKVIDKTRYAGRESFEGMSIGAPDIVKQLEEKDAENVVDIDDFLNGLNKAPTALPGAEDKKLLEEYK